MKMTTKRSTAPREKSSPGEMSIQLAISPTWSLIQEIQEKTKLFMKKKSLGKELTEAAIMCATELIENAIKYGSGDPGKSNITFDLSTDNTAIFIKISNQIRSKREIKVLKEHIGRIKSSSDPSLLYTQRLKELMSNPKPGISQLGLFRIAYEGRFSLEYECSDKVLTITASRTF